MDFIIIQYFKNAEYFSFDCIYIINFTKIKIKPDIIRYFLFFIRICLQ